MTDQNPTQPTRVFKIGATRIVADASHVPPESTNRSRDLLKTTYPEIAHATLRETTLEDGTQVLEWAAIPGRKG